MCEELPFNICLLISTGTVSGHWLPKLGTKLGELLYSMETCLDRKWRPVMSDGCKILAQLLRMNRTACLPWRASGSGSRLALVTLVLLLGAGGARADLFDITFTNVTFSASCVGGGTCSEVVNGSVLFDSVAFTLSSVSLQLTGSYSATLIPGPAPHCASPLCLPPIYSYDSGANPSDDPIEFSPDLPTLFAPTPTALVSDTALYIPSLCGGDQATCGAAGNFPVGADFESPSGTFTSIDVTTPEPNSAIPLMTVFAIGAFLLRRKFPTRSDASRR